MLNLAHYPFTWLDSNEAPTSLDDSNTLIKPYTHADYKIGAHSIINPILSLNFQSVRQDPKADFYEDGKHPG